MADRRRKGNKAAKDEPKDDKIPKETEAIAKFVRFNCPTKMAMFEGNEVHYFTGRKAVETLVESKKYGAGSKDPKFSNPAQAEAFLSNLLANGLFFRAKILVAKKKEDPRRAKKEDVKESPQVKRVKQGEESNKEGDTAGETETDTKKEEKKEEEKKKKKVKVVVHDNQVFKNDSDVYVWVFDPTPLFKKVIGFLIVIGVILACLFPLWPDWLRLGVYYLSVTGISLFGLLLAVAFLRTILFCAIYAATWGRHKLWILPNLTEDCGFFESFQPWYTYEYIAPGETSEKKKKKKKDSDEEPLIEDVEEEKPSTSSKGKTSKKEEPKSKTSKKEEPKSKESKKKEESPAPPPDPHTNKKPKEQEEQEETDPEEKYSKPSTEDENSAAEEDEVTENDEATNASTGDSSEPVDVKMEDTTPAVDETPVEEEEPKQPAGGKSRRRRVRRADDEDYVMVHGEEDH